MLALTIGFLDGSSETVEQEQLSLQYTIAELRKDLEQQRGIGKMHEIKLIQGDREVQDGDRIQIDLQAMTVASPAKAVATIHRISECCTENRSFGMDMVEEVIYEDMEAALAVLDEERDLSTDLCEQLLQDGVIYDNYAGRIGRTFGRACGDPYPYVERLTAMLKDQNRESRLFASAALAEIASDRRASLHDHAKDIARTALQLLDRWGVRLAFRCDLVLVKCACDLLDDFGAADDIPELKELVPQMIYQKFGDMVSNTIKAIEKREMLHLKVDARLVSEENKAVAAAEPDVPQESTDETENAASLAQALINSRQDVPKTGIPLNSDGVVVLRLTRMARSDSLRQHLQTVRTLQPCRQRVEDAGCELVASWSCGAQLFVPVTLDQVDEAGLELAFDHVVILNSDVDLFKRALHEFNCRGKRRPTLALDYGCFKETPQDTFALGHLSAASLASGYTGSRGSEDSEEDEGSVEVEPVAFFTLRTDSSLGFPEYQYE